VVAGYKGDLAMKEQVERRESDRRLRDDIESEDEGGRLHDKLDAWRSNLIALVMDWRQQLGSIASELNHGGSQDGLLGIKDVSSQIDDAARTLFSIRDEMTEKFNVLSARLEESIWDGRKG
jgi:hypothetical protein